MLGRLYEDLAILQRAIRVGLTDATLEAHFSRTRAIRAESSRPSRLTYPAGAG